MEEEFGVGVQVLQSTNNVVLEIFVYYMYCENYSSKY